MELRKLISKVIVMKGSRFDLKGTILTDDNAPKVVQSNKSMVSNGRRLHETNLPADSEER